MKVSKLILVSVFLTACAQTPSKAPDDFQYSATAPKIIRDNRPAIDSKYEVMSLSVGSCLYGTYRRGDIETQPSKMDILNSEIAQSFGDTAGLSVEVDRYFIFLTKHDHGRAVVQSMEDAKLVGGILPSMMGASNCKKEQMGEAAFDESEVEQGWPNSDMKAVLQISFKINNKIGVVRLVRPFDGGLITGDNPSYTKFIFDLMKDGAHKTALKASELSGLPLVAR